MTTPEIPPSIVLPIKDLGAAVGELIGELYRLGYRASEITDFIVSITRHACVANEALDPWKDKL